VSNAVIVSGALVGTRELITEFGVDPGPLAAEAGLTERLFDEPDIFVQADRVVDFFELAAQHCRSPDFGLLHARRLPMGIFWQLWIGMRTAQNMRTALSHYVQSYGLYTDGASCRTDAERDDLWLEYSILPLGRFGVSQLVNLTIGHLCLFIAENLGPGWKPKRVLLRIEPEDPDPFVRFFGAGVVFGQDRDAILVDRATLCAPMVIGKSHRFLRSSPMHKSVTGSLVITQARAMLSALLRHDHCSIASIARGLGMSERSLQRRLNETGTTYRELVDSVRADLALRHVQRTDLSLAQVADLLGYNSQTAFSRAFRRWHGMNPRAARQRPTG